MKISPTGLIIINALFMMISACQQKENSVECRHINDNWLFHQKGSGQLYDAEVPGCVHLDLFYNDLIGNPFYRDNEEKLQWIEDEDWIYTNHFLIDSNDLNADHIELVFNGLDTYAEIFLNGETLFKADNMFRTWAFECKNHLRPGENELKLVFSSAVRVGRENAGKITYSLPDIRGFSRKAPYHYGWDWGPRFVTSGIWRPVALLFWKQFMIDNAHLHQKELSEDLAKISLQLTIESNKDQKVEVILEDLNSATERYKGEFHLSHGTNILNFPFQIENPRLWWTHDLGEPYLYDFMITVQNDDLRDQRKITAGLRTIELVQEPDEKGSSFMFRLNGEPVFIRGANYIPQESFVPRLRAENYEKLLEAAVDANMNMLRVWGGGIYEEDIFYDLCDKKGVMVWQDFMFACNMYPGDSSFLENVKAEAIDNVVRLRGHPCLVLWCGNNEVEEGWKHWNWQKELGYSFQDSMEVWSHYVRIFHEILPSVIDQYDTGKPYWPSSPSTGWGLDSAYRMGDVHYWGVWWGEEPFAMYEKRIGRFMSEFGFQGMPGTQTIEQFTLPEERKIGSPVMEAHQKHPRGTRLIQTYMERDYPVPDEFEDYVYVSQLLQAEGIRLALEAHRRAKPYCMGTLYWQLNDCWPVTSWSSVDYYGRWKALHYHARKAFQPIIISCAMDSVVKFHVISDLCKDTSGKVEIMTMDFEGRTIWAHKQDIAIPSSSNRLILMADRDEMKGGMDENEVFLLMRIYLDGAVRARNIAFLSPAKNLRLPLAEIDCQMDSIPEGIRITLRSDKLVRGVCLSAPDPDEFYSDNYFDILPGIPVEIDYSGTLTLEDFKEKLTIKSLNALMSK